MVRGFVCAVSEWEWGLTDDGAVVVWSTFGCVFGAMNRAAFATTTFFAGFASSNSIRSGTFATLVDSQSK